MQGVDLTWSSALLIPGVHTAKRRGREWCGVSADPQGWQQHRSRWWGRPKWLLRDTCCFCEIPWSDW